MFFFLESFVGILVTDKRHDFHLLYDMSTYYYHGDIMSLNFCFPVIDTTSALKGVVTTIERHESPFRRDFDEQFDIVCTGGGLICGYQIFANSRSKPLIVWNQFLKKHLKLVIPSHCY